MMVFLRFIGWGGGAEKQAVSYDADLSLTLLISYFYLSKRWNPSSTRLVGNDMVAGPRA